MKKLKTVKCFPRCVAGGIIAIHGLLRIIFIEQYMNFVLLNFVDLIPSPGFLTIGSALFPFVEFFAGLLLLTNVSIKKSIWLAIVVSVVMSAFILAAQLYTRLIYHVIMLGILTYVLVQRQMRVSGNNLLQGSKSKIDSGEKYFF